MPDMLLVDLPPKTDLLELPFTVTERLAQEMTDRNGVQNGQDLLRLLDQLVRVFEGWPASFRSFFQTCARDLRPDRVPAFHELRSVLHGRWAEAHAGCERLLTFCAERQAPLPGLGEMTARIQKAKHGLEVLEHEFFESWQSVEDLWDLLAAHFPLSQGELLKLAEKYKPDPSWYAEEGKPF